MTRSLLLTNARVVDARGLVAEQSNVSIDGSAIAAIGDTDATSESTVFDLGGRTICPGLMNAHVHVCFDSTANPQQAFDAESDQDSVANAQLRLARTVASGVTTVRDLGGKAPVTLQLARMIGEGEALGPSILTAGKVICVPGGHGHWMGIEIEGASEAKAAARGLIDSGASVIKLMATAGMMTDGQEAGAPQLSVDEMKACIEEAHAAGIHVAAHSESRQGAANAISAGVDSIEHGHGLDRPLLEKMVEKGIALVPTISCDRVIVTEGLDAGVPDFIVADCARLAPSLETALREAIELGVIVAAGNDGGAPLTDPGDIVAELEVYVEMGMTPQQALASATVANAHLFGLTDRGLVEPGQRADLLVVDGDPLTSVNALRHPDLVIAAGTLVTGEGAAIIE